jgi:hypothetical protein
MTYRWSDVNKTIVLSLTRRSSRAPLVLAKWMFEGAAPSFCGQECSTPAKITGGLACCASSTGLRSALHSPVVFWGATHQHEHFLKLHLRIKKSHCPAHFITTCFTRYITGLAKFKRSFILQNIYLETLPLLISTRLFTHWGTSHPTSCSLL